ncbi:hypothetical protein DL770_001266 [Monosporascus sp. CRB-9-2]|nr:hypothetical protein DL770_001266 [Monosporascus sp. CRB-9-2]
MIVTNADAVLANELSRGSRFFGVQVGLCKRATPNGGCEGLEAKLNEHFRGWAQLGQQEAVTPRAVPVLDDSAPESGRGAYPEPRSERTRYNVASAGLSGNEDLHIGGLYVLISAYPPPRPGNTTSVATHCPAPERAAGTGMRLGAVPARGSAHRSAVLLSASASASTETEEGKANISRLELSFDVVRDAGSRPGALCIMQVDQFPGVMFRDDSGSGEGIWGRRAHRRPVPPLPVVLRKVRESAEVDVGGDGYAQEQRKNTAQLLREAVDGLVKERKDGVSGLKIPLSKGGDNGGSVLYWPGGLWRRRRDWSWIEDVAVPSYWYDLWSEMQGE